MPRRTIPHPEHVYQRIRALLILGNRSIRSIAKELGVSRCTVHRTKVRMEKKQKGTQQRKRKETIGNPVCVAAYKCPGCNRIVYWSPCQICRVLHSVMGSGRAESNVDRIPEQFV